LDLSAPPVVTSEVTRFLRDHQPFNALEPDEVERVAATAVPESYEAGETIFPEGAGPVEYLRVIRTGSIEVVHGGRAIDLMGPGELFGHSSLLSGLPTGFEARAAEDTECYRIGADVAREALGSPAGLRYIARSLLDWPGAAPAGFLNPGAVGVPGSGEPLSDPAQQPVGALVRAAPVLCTPETTVREAARSMNSAGVGAAVVQLPDGAVGIFTDHDLRERVAAGLDTDAPLSAAMTSPASTCGADRLGGEVLLDMLDRGISHFPVLSATGAILGVIEDRDLVAVHTRSSFFLRQRIAQARCVEDVVAAANQLAPMMIAMSSARIAPVNVLAVRAVVVDALTRRLLELAIEQQGEPKAQFAWLALGSQARREATPSADVDSAIAWFGDVPEAEIKPQLMELARRVMGGLEACGFSQDEHGATVSNPGFVRSVGSWQRAARSWIRDPTQEKALILASVLVDSRPVWGVHTGSPVSDTFRLAPDNPQTLRLIARLALVHRPPTGFFRGLVVEHSGEHRGRLDLKLGGMLPITDLARWAGMAAGVTSASTIERLRVAGDAGTLLKTDANTLEDAFELITGIRLEHQIEQLRAGHELDDHVDPASLSPLTRSYLRVAFRAVASIQKRLAAELKVGVM
jgi:CBS domain-containing protein